MKRTFLFCSLLLPGILYAAVCKTVGDDGLVKFQNVPGTECPAGWILTDYGNPMTPGPRVRALEAGVSGRQVPFAGYQSVEIISPANAGTVRDNEGKVTVEVTLVPSLRQSDFITVYVDGKAYRARYGSSRLALKDVDRGTHTLRVKVSDSRGSTLIESETISFTLQKKAVEQVIVIEPITGDDFISGEEARRKVPITGKTLGEVEAVAITFLGTTKVYEAELRDDGSWTVEVPGAVHDGVALGGAGAVAPDRRSVGAGDRVHVAAVRAQRIVAGDCVA